ncbi:hypothetical protein AMR74_15085 [Halorubrum tropicale]|uniref:Uncharacterized protein n=1 Tax=Halorubrum tropicale TaxID=1765655 RepID=A0A0N0BQI7_9EURY|nr:hypothetical protein AMR74_15085 [Halorubrum tropicale]
MKLSFRRDNIAVFSPVPAVVYDHLGGLFEAVYRLLEKLVSIVVDVEFHDGSTAKLHKQHIDFRQ